MAKHSASPSRSRTPSRSRSPAPSSHRRRRRRQRSPSVSASRSDSPSRSRSPDRNRRRRYSRSPSRWRSYRRRRSPSDSRSPDRRRRSPSPILDTNPRRRDERERQRQERQRRLRQPSRSLSRSPPPQSHRTAPPSSPPVKPLVTTSGAYIPPARLRQMQAEITDKSSAEYQRLTWDALKKSINGFINKANTANIKEIIPELLRENLVRGRGLFARSLMKAQSLSGSFTPVYAALVAVVNSKLPMVGELLVQRLVIQFRRAFRQNHKANCLTTTQFIAQLTNQRIIHELLAFEILQLLLDNPTDDAVEVAVGFMKECGAHLSDTAPQVINSIFEIFRSILHEADIDERIQYMIEVLFHIRKSRFEKYPAIPAELDIVEEDDQITHQISLEDDSVRDQNELNVFKFDPEYEAHEAKYSQFRSEVLGDADEDDSDGDEGSSGSGSDSDSDNDDGNKITIQDRTGTNIINLRRTIYLTIMSSANFEEGVHKLMQLRIEPGLEIELCNMIIECCAQERTYLKFYGLIGERFCKINRRWAHAFEQCFVETYETIHQYETNRLRNIAQYFSHLFATDALPWPALSIITLSEETTSSSSRIFIKILMLGLAEALGLQRLHDRLKDPATAEAFQGLFPMDNPKHTRFAINYFVSIGLGALTVDLREHLANAPKTLLGHLGDTSSDSDDSSSDDDDSSSGSGSDSDGSRRSSRSASSSRSVSRSPRRKRSSRRSSDSDDSRRSSRSSKSVSRSPRRARPSRYSSDSE
ncbi:armadillo-type protein [Dimargaris cristalligena]|uniref:Armadillo-type protein n=1 Tax=Dimargaris cristalligena TaxID=215637 RepID=A0A4Q0A365_9FUNG|nr:armadillo-type protein [Dimargaris cristalligena]|eukprot:RKP40308.1 armadillo-type protein [Dimargaris cristalligena]